MAKRSLERRKGIKEARRARKKITGGPSGNSHDRRQKRRHPVEGVDQCLRSHRRGSGSNRSNSA